MAALASHRHDVDPVVARGSAASVQPPHHEGTVRRRHHEQQTEQVLCLSLVTNAVITWNTAYLELALERLS